LVSPLITYYMQFTYLKQKEMRPVMAFSYLLILRVVY
jgi:hypothetical protein